MSSDEELFRQYDGHIVPQSYNAGWVALSFVVSLVGAGSSLELINRRTGLHGLFNNVLLVGSAITMGGVAIWSMHFIGNRAINLADGQKQLQIAYSGGITAVSFLVPIGVLLAAFVAIGGNTRVSWWRIASGGVLCGAAVCGMHYLGNASIENYRCVYEMGNVIGAAIISVVASTVALAMFFVFRSIWANSWWKRLLSAIVLAGAVSGMHWVAAVGTKYRLVKIHNGTMGPSRDATVIVVICLSVSACLVIAGSAALKARAMSKSARRAQKITLGAAVFDKHGRILVDTDGVAPSAVITDSFLEKHAREGFNTAHPLFHWMFQSSRSWGKVSGLVGGMKAHLNQLAQTSGDRMGARIELVNSHGEVTENYDLIFRELFCVAAATLCERMGQPLTSAGLLWNEILPTGTYVDRSRGQLKRRSSASSVVEKAAAMPALNDFGRGSLMFLVRRVDNDRDVARLASAGYRFAEVHQVSSILRSRMQIQSLEVGEKLKQMAAYVEDKKSPTGVHLGFFGIRARVNTSGFEVLVQKPSRASLPSVAMPIETLEPAHRDFLRTLDGLTVLSAVRELEKTRGREHTPAEGKFAEQLAVSVLHLRGLVQEPLFDHAVLMPETVTMPTSLDDPSATMELLTFHLVIPIHCVISSQYCDFIPLSFFKVQQASMQDPLLFERGIHLEFGPVVQKALNPEVPEHGWRARLGHRHHKGNPSQSLRMGSVEAGRAGGSRSRQMSISKSLPSSSTDELVIPDGASNISGHRDTMASRRADSAGTLGGILVSQEITVGIEPAALAEAGNGRRGEAKGPAGSGGGYPYGNAKPAASVEMRELGSSAAVSRLGSGPGIGKVDAPGTFVDVLFARCIEGR